MNLSKARAAQASRLAAAAALASAEQAAVADGATFCLRALDDELFDRSLNAVTGPRPSVATATAIVKALTEKVAAGYRLAADTDELLRLAQAVASA